MQISITEQLNLSIVKGSKLYQEWDSQNNLPSYLSVILYELLIRQKLTQKQLVDLSSMPKQSINKGIKILQDQGYLEMTPDPTDKRIKFCQLTTQGKEYAQKKMQPLMDLEERIAKKMGINKMKQLVELSNEWNATFAQLLDDKQGGRKGDL